MPSLLFASLLCLAPASTGDRLLSYSPRGDGREQQQCARPSSLGDASSGLTRVCAVRRLEEPSEGGPAFASVLSRLLLFSFLLLLFLAVSLFFFKFLSSLRHWMCYTRCLGSSFFLFLFSIISDSLFLLILSPYPSMIALLRTVAIYRSLFLHTLSFYATLRVIFRVLYHL